MAIAIVPISYFEFSRHYFEFKSSQLAFPGGRAQYAMSAVDFFGKFSSARLLATYRKIKNSFEN